MKRVLFVLFAAAALVQLTLAAQDVRPAAPPEMDALKRLTFRNIGPANKAGRVSVIVGVPGDPDTYYVAGANGGIIKTMNGGTTFKAIFDEQDVLSIGAIAIAPSNPNIVYVGTGEENPRNNASFGDGMYKSHRRRRDTGRTSASRSRTRSRGSSSTPQIPTSSTRARSGASGGRTRSAASSRRPTAARRGSACSTSTRRPACSDIAADPGNSNIVYAGMCTYRRWAWHLESRRRRHRGLQVGGRRRARGAVEGSRTRPSEDGMDRIGVAVAPSDPDVVYMVSETKDTKASCGARDDAGDHWRVVNSRSEHQLPPVLLRRHSRRSAESESRVLALRVAVHVGGRRPELPHDRAATCTATIRRCGSIRTNPKCILSGIATAAGRCRYDGGKNFEVVNNFPFTQFYHINYDMQRPYMVCGGLQDNGNWCGPSQRAVGAGHPKNDWYTVAGGDGFFTVPVMDKPWLVYSDAQGGDASTSPTRAPARSKTIYPYPNRVGSVGDAMISHKYRFNWNSPIALVAADPNVVYFGGNVLFKSTDYGQSWQVISPDLTTNDPKKQAEARAARSSSTTPRRNSTARSSRSRRRRSTPNVIWVGTDDGNVQVTRDGGKTWTNVVQERPGPQAERVDPDRRSVARRRGHGVRRRGSSSGRRLRAVRLHDDRLRQDVEADHRRPAERPRLGARRCAKIRRTATSCTSAPRSGVWASWDRGAHWVVAARRTCRRCRCATSRSIRATTI